MSIENRPKYLNENLEFYSSFPKDFSFRIDFKSLPPLLNLDLHVLNGILPVTKSRFEYVGQNGEVDGVKGTVLKVNPLPEEYEYYENLGIQEFQAIQLVFNFYAIERISDTELLGKPYSLSLYPMTKNGAIDTWNIGLLKNFDLEELCQQGRYVMTGFDPFQGWYDGLVMDYSIYSMIAQDDHSDSIGFIWGMYFLVPKFDKREVHFIKNHTYSNEVNAKYKKFKVKNYFDSFANTHPRRIWGLESPIELFMLQGLYTRNIFPELQVCIFKNGNVYPNYYKMAESEIFIGLDKLLTSIDFFLPENNIGIFCDGAEFHDEAKDAKIDQNLRQLGITPLRFSGKRITEDLDNVLNEIEKLIQKNL